MSKCLYHLCEQEGIISNGKFCDNKCKLKYYTDAKRKKLKLDAVEYMGGKCKLCGYSNCRRALQFHHLNPLEKDFGISASGHTKSWARIKLELDKCIMVCSNCHMELHEQLEKLKFLPNK